VGGEAKTETSGSRLVAVLAIVALAALGICTGLGYRVAQHSDARLLSEQRAAIRNAVAEFRVLFAVPGQVDPRFVRMVEQSAGVKSLKFEVDPPPGRDEMQPVLDDKGRIAGFFTWQRYYPMTAAIGRLWPLMLGTAALLTGFVGFSLWQLRRARRQLQASEDIARRAADEDRITGLANHARTLELLDRALAERARDAVVTFALIEIDGMADIIADLGVLASDELYASVAGRLKGALPSDALCGRTGSNEFAVMFAAGSEVDSGAVILSVLDAVARPYWIDTVARVTAHAGFARAPHHAATRGELIRRAGLALRAAAKKGPGSVLAFEPALDAASGEQKFLRRELPRAVSANDFELHYQPIVAAENGRIVGVEALLRWSHATHGAIPPATFVPIAEQMGLMDAIGAFVLRRALWEAKRWSGLYVAVNLSPLQVRDGGIVDLVREALAESGVPPQRLMLEITEGVLIDNPDEMVRRIQDLHALGVRIALDDFGSGYSSLGYLQKFPLDKLKIDKSFAAALGQSANGGVIVQAIVTLGRALGLSVLVEGVETEEQRTLLRLAGCDEMQGFLFAKPAPARVIDRLLAQPAGVPSVLPVLSARPLTA
jgi:diguanylate cyclase (GGDEF)-like protein